MPDAHKNFASSLVATAPSPATSGTSLVVTTGDGTKFPAAPFNATIWPAGATSSTANAEIVRVTAVSTDTLTITRAQESTSARTVIVGDQIVASITAKTLTDVEAASQALRDVYLRPAASLAETWPRALSSTTSAPVSGSLFLAPIALTSGMTIGHIAFPSVFAAAASPLHWWFGLYDSSFAQLAVTADQTTTAWAANTLKSLAVATVATGAASTFTTTYTGVHYVGFMMQATTVVDLPQVGAGSGSVAVGLAPRGGQSNTGQTTPPAFPFTATTPSNTTLPILAYAYVAA